MSSSLSYWAWAALLVLLVNDPASAQDAEPEAATEAAGPRYLAEVRAELESLGVQPTCEILDPMRARCSFLAQSADRTREGEITVLIDAGTQTAYIYGELGRAHPEHETTMNVLRRVAELNWRLLATKLEWNPTSGMLRVSAVQHLDSNFDRRAFRVLVRIVTRQADEYRQLFARLTRGPA